MFHVCQRVLACAAVWCALIGMAGQDFPGQALPTLIRANELFGRTLLERLHRRMPERNVVVSPISLSLIFGALHEGSFESAVRNEISKAFGWGERPNLQVPSRMLLVPFEKPISPPVERQGGAPRSSLERPEAVWISNNVVYRGTDTLSKQFVASAEKYFGMTFASTGDSRPTVDDIRRAPSTGAYPDTLPWNDVLISSGVHLQTVWKGNTFAFSKPFQGEFETGQARKVVEMLTSEVSSYRYAKTQTFEAVVLPGNRAYLLAVLPAPGQGVLSFERDLVMSLDAVDAALKPQAGTVTMPPFSIRLELNLRTQLEELGVRRVFTDLGNIITIPKSRLTEINQKVDLQVDKVGIRANAETVGGGIYGGVMSAVEPFNMKLNRPFVFLVRESITGALLFLGAVVDPSLN